MKKQPFLTSFPLAVFATAARRIQAALRFQRERVIRASISGYALVFEAVLPPDFLERIDPTKRHRKFGHIPVFWAWLSQILEANASCSKALGLIQSWYQAAKDELVTMISSHYALRRSSISSPSAMNPGRGNDDPRATSYSPDPGMFSRKTHTVKPTARPLN